MLPATRSPYLNISLPAAEPLSIRLAAAVPVDGPGSCSPISDSFSSGSASGCSFGAPDRGIKFHGVERCVAVLLGISSASSSCRRRTWLALFGVRDHAATPRASCADMGSAHADDAQVWLDVNRCLFCHDLSESPSAVHSSPSAALAALRGQLHAVIMDVLRSDTSFKYTQGFHDFCAVVLHVINGEQSACDAAEVARDFICAAGRRHLRSSLCDPNLDAAVTSCSRVFRVLLVIDEPLALHMQALDVNPVVCLSWILTLFTHPLSGHTAHAVEVLDFIFASDDDYTVLLCACIIADNSPSLLQIRDGGEAFKAILMCPVTSLLPTHRRRMCLCRALQMSLSKHTSGGGTCLAAAINAAIDSSSADTARASPAHATRPREIRP